MNNRVQRWSYGDHVDQYVEWWAPAEGGVAGVVVLIHGGFWRARYDCALMHPLAADLAARGIGAWNIEYRRVGSNGGDPLVTLGDVADAADRLATFVPEGRDRPAAGARVPTAVVGHSAGGHLAAWVGGRIDQVLPPRLVISQAGVLDLRTGAEDRLGDGAIQDFLGGEPADVPDRYRAATPRLDATRMHAVHGSRDDTVPLSQSLEAIDEHGRALPVTVVDADHMDVIDPEHHSWERQLELIQEAWGRA